MTIRSFVRFSIDLFQQMTESERVLAFWPKRGKDGFRSQWIRLRGRFDLPRTNDDPFQEENEEAEGVADRRERPGEEENSAQPFVFPSFPFTRSK